jgi:hypothetical protein
MARTATTMMVIGSRVPTSLGSHTGLGARDGSGLYALGVPTP